MATTAPTSALLSFLPWVRQGAAAALSLPDTLGADMRGAAELKAGLSVNGATPQSVTLRLRGPADVVGIDPRQIVRMDPQPGSSDFEPNYFAGIEFDRPDFPWLFTPASAGSQARLRPWLCLAVVKLQPGVSLNRRGDAPLPSLDIAAPARPADELPDLDESWAWAHAQAAGGGAAPSEVRNALSGRPELSLSRLLCPRLLEADTDYLACVVPTFAGGVKAGLGQAIKEEDLGAAGSLAPAWSFKPAPPTGVRLPVYHHWQFRTGQRGDFESMVRRLRALPPPEGLGTRPMDVSRPGFRTAPPDALKPGLALTLEGALKPLEQPDLPATWSAAEAKAFQDVLAVIVNAPGLAEVLQPGSDPLLAPPLYGRWHAGRPTVAPGSAVWLDELNLDPRHRVVAAFGTRVVQEHQEALMAAAWEQAADLERANQRLRQLQLSLSVGTSLLARHFARLSDEAVLRITSPAHMRLRAVTPAGAGTGAASTLLMDLRASPLPQKAASAAMRRIGRDRGPLTRRVMAQGGNRSMQASWLVKLNAPGMGSFASAARWDVASFDLVRERIAQPTSLSRFGNLTADAVANMRGRPVFRIEPDGAPVAVPGVNNVSPALDSPTAHSFRLAAAKHLGRIDPGRTEPPAAPLPPLDFAAVRAGLQAQLEPRRTLSALAQALVSSGSLATPAVNPAPEAPVPFEPVMAAPKFRQPMYEPLRDLSQDLLLPGLDRVDENTVLGLQTNQRFVEAYMVGLNVEMGHELLWRGYPTDQRGTCFDQFWDAPRTTDPQGFVLNPAADIFPLHQWGSRGLGEADTAPAPERFVMLLRSDLLRRYPSAMVYAAKAVDVDGVRMPSIDPAQEAMPVFRGAMPPDVSFFGFDIPVATMLGGDGDMGYFVVIQEQPGEPRFGLDEDTPRGEATHLRVAAGVPPGLPLGGLEWGRNAAHMAGIVRQQPVRVGIHASRFLRKAKT